MNTHPTPDEIIDALGGTSKVAEIFDIAPSSVSEWRNSPNGIPKPRLMYLRLAYPLVFNGLLYGNRAEAQP